MEINENLIEKVGRNPNLNAAEKETSINMYGDEKKMRIFSAKPTIVKSLLRNNHFEPEWVAGDHDGSYQKVPVDQADDLNTIYSVSGSAPVGLLTVKSKPRSNSNQSGIVNWKGVDQDAFS